MSQMLDSLEKHLNKLQVFEGNIPEIVTAIADSIPSNTIPYKMKLAFAVSEIVTFVSQFRRNIQHWNGSIIPINSVMFCIAKSGASKDSSVKAARKCFSKSYELINEERKEYAKQKAIEKAKEDGCDPLLVHKWVVYGEYYIAPNPLFVAISTSEGFIQHLNDLAEDPLGAGYIYSGEVGAELTTNANLVENIKVIAELYDEGSKEVKILKSRENQSKEVKNLPVSALFMGSQDNILFDESIRRKFRTEFTTKLARRSFFIFADEDIEPEHYASIVDMLKAERIREDTAIINRNEVAEYLNELTPTLLDSAGIPITVTDDVRDLFALYNRYNVELSNQIDNQFPMTKLTRAHLQWKALKLAGAFALITGSNEITVEDYKGAIEFVELINKDIQVFERELVKEQYELFAEYCYQNAKDNEYFITLHYLRKQGYIPMKGTPTGRMKELVQLVSSYDDRGTYEYISTGEEGIYYRKIDKKDKILVSFVPVSGTKKARMTQCNKGYICEEYDFSDLQNMLEGDYAYTPFRFTDGNRGKDNIESGCKWIVLDVDSSEITDSEAHLLLSDINHFIVRTSDPKNPHKFRVIVELDAEVDIPDNQWNYFIQSISEELGITTDKLPKSQIFFSYAASSDSILSTLDAEPLEARIHVQNAIDRLSTVEKPLTANQKSSLLDDPMNTFDKAFQAKSGEGSRKMIWAAKRARELGADKEYILNLMEQINNYWISGMDRIRFENTILNQINRWNFNQ